MKQGYFVTSLVFLFIVLSSCNKQAPNASPQPCISGPWYESKEVNGDYLETSLNAPFSVSATCSTDADSDTLTARWDWMADGTWDTYLISIHTTVHHQYPDTGWYELILSVDDGKIATIESAMVHVK